MNQEIKKNISYYIVIDTKPNKQDLHKIYVRFLHAGKKKDYFTGIRWKIEKFDRINELLLPRFLQDPDVDRYNHTIKEIKNRINKLAVESYLKNVYYSIDDYIKAITQHASLSDFAIFMQDTIRHTQLKGVISYETYKKHKSILTKIKEFFGEVIPMASITPERIQEFEAHYQKAGRLRNTITSYHKVFAKYIGIAVEKGLLEKNPYAKIKYTFVPGTRVALSQDEVKKLYSVFMLQTLPMIEHEVLRRFLFSCITGLRISDTHQITSEHISDKGIIIKPHKTRKTGKTITIPLPHSARKLIENRLGKLFAPFADQSINRILKRIALMAEINPDLTYHSARDTFGTIFIELGGDVKSLCDLMGHSSIRITEIYLKMADKRKAQLMNNFDSLF